MGWLLNGVYLVVVLVASPWLLWRACRDGKYREGWAAKWLGRVPRRCGTEPCIWLHAVSLGEVNLLATLIRDLCQRRPDVTCVVSTTTRSGFEAARRLYGGEHRVIHCPLDFTWSVANALRRIRPDVLVLAELELWPNLIRSAKRRGTHVTIVNGRLSSGSYRGYARLRWLMPYVFGSISRIAAQTETYAARFRALGACDTTILVTGSLKFDGAQSDRANPATLGLARLVGLRSDDIVWVAGSTSVPEEQYVIDVFSQLSVAYPQLRLILVPRHPERFEEVAERIAQCGLSWCRRKQLNGEGRPVPPWRILLVDTIGELGAWWGTARIAFVGGSMGIRGGQNMIEPSAFGAAVCFGPKTDNFREIVRQLLDANAATVVQDSEQLASFVRRCLDDPEFAIQQGRRARQLVIDNRGATRRTVEQLINLLPGLTSTTNRPASRRRASA